MLYVVYVIGANGKCNPLGSPQKFDSKEVDLINAWDDNIHAMPLEMWIKRQKEVA